MQLPTTTAQPCIDEKKGAAMYAAPRVHLESTQFGGGLKPPVQVLPPVAVKSTDATRFGNKPLWNRQRATVPLGVTVIVTLVLPLLLANQSRATFLLVAETFAPVMECVLFWLAFGTPAERGRRSMWRDFAAIVVANLASFLVGELLNAWGWFGLLDQLR